MSNEDKELRELWISLLPEFGSLRLFPKDLIAVEDLLFWSSRIGGSVRSRDLQRVFRCHGRRLFLRRSSALLADFFSWK